MNKISLLLAATLLALGTAAHAVPGDVNLDGSVKHKKPTLAATANTQLQQAAVPSAKAAPVDVKSQADAEMASRDARARGPHLQVQRQNLKGGDAAHAIAQQTTPSTIDHDTAYGDIDHTEQLADVKISIKK